MFRKTIAFLISFCFIFEQPGLAQFSGQVDLSRAMPLFSTRVQAADVFHPQHLRYLSYDSFANHFSVLVDKGSPKEFKQDELAPNAGLLFKYFLIGITLPNDTFWVNLRPDAPDIVIDPLLEKTDIGRIMLEADVQLKKDTAAATSPETAEGKQYWDKLYSKAEQLFGTRDVSVPTLTRPWIVPDEIIIREAAGNAYIYKATLKILLEDDYLKGSSEYSFKDQRAKELNAYASGLMREQIIPRLTRQVNTSRKYAALRQVYFSLILAQWFKQSFAGQPGMYPGLIDTKQLQGLESAVPWSKKACVDQYKRSFEQGEYNLKIQSSDELKSYVAGGIGFVDLLAKAVAVFTAKIRVQPGSAVVGLEFTGGRELRPEAVEPALVEQDKTVEPDLAGGDGGEKPEKVRNSIASFEYNSLLSSFRGVDLEHFVSCQNKLAEKQLPDETVRKVCAELGISPENNADTYSLIYEALARSGYTKKMVDLLNNGSYENPRLNIEISRQNQAPRMQSVFEAISNGLDAHRGFSIIGQFGKGIKQILYWLGASGSDSVQVFSRKANGKAYRLMIRQDREGQDYISLQEITVDEFAKYTRKFGGEALDHGTVVRVETGAGIPLLEKDRGENDRTSQEAIIRGIQRRYPFISEVDIFTQRQNQPSPEKVNGFKKKVVIVGKPAASDAEGRYVKVTLAAHSVTVVDNGGGMGAANISRMFVPREGDEQKQSKPLSGDSARDELEETRLVHTDPHLGEQGPPAEPASMPQGIYFSRNGEVIFAVDMPADLVPEAAVPGGLQVELARLMDVGESRDTINLPFTLKEGEVSNFELGIEHLIKGVCAHPKLPDRQKAAYVNTIIIGLDGLIRENDNYRIIVDRIQKSTAVALKPVVSALRGEGVLILPHAREFANLLPPAGRTVLFLHPALFDWNDNWQKTLEAMGASIVPRKVLTLGGEKKLALVFAPFKKERVSHFLRFNRSWHTMDLKDLFPFVTTDRCVVLPDIFGAELLELLKKRPAGLSEKEDKLLKSLLERINIISGEEIVTSYEVAEPASNMLVQSMPVQSQGEIDSAAVRNFLASPVVAETAVGGEKERALYSKMKSSFIDILSTVPANAAIFAKMYNALLENQGRIPDAKSIRDAIVGKLTDQDLNSFEWINEALDEFNPRIFARHAITNSVTVDQAVEWTDPFHDGQKRSNALLDYARLLIEEKRFGDAAYLLRTQRALGKDASLKEPQLCVALCDLAVAERKAGLIGETIDELFAWARVLADQMGDSRREYLGYYCAALIVAGEPARADSVLKELLDEKKRYSAGTLYDAKELWDIDRAIWQIIRAKAQTGDARSALDLAGSLEKGIYQASAFSLCVVALCEAGNTVEIVQETARQYIKDDVFRAYALSAVAKALAKKGQNDQAADFFRAAVDAASTRDITRLKRRAETGADRIRFRVMKGVSSSQADFIFHHSELYGIGMDDDRYGLYSLAEEAVERSAPVSDIVSAMMEAGLTTEADSLIGKLIYSTEEVDARLAAGTVLLRQGKTISAYEYFSEAVKTALLGDSVTYLLCINGLATVDGLDTETLAVWLEQLIDGAGKRFDKTACASVLSAAASALAKSSKAAEAAGGARSSPKTGRFEQISTRAAALVKNEALRFHIQLHIADELRKSGRNAEADQLLDQVIATLPPKEPAEDLDSLQSQAELRMIVEDCVRVLCNAKRWDQAYKLIKDTMGVGDSEYSGAMEDIISALAESGEEKKADAWAEEIPRDHSSAMEDLALFYARSGDSRRAFKYASYCNDPAVRFEAELELAKLPGSKIFTPDVLENPGWLIGLTLMQGVLAMRDEYDQSHCFARLGDALLERGFSKQAGQILSEAMRIAKTDPGSEGNKARNLRYIAAYALMAAILNGNENEITAAEKEYSSLKQVESSFIEEFAAILNKSRCDKKHAKLMRFFAIELERLPLSAMQDAPAAFAAIGEPDAALDMCAGIKNLNDRHEASFRLIRTLAENGLVDQAGLLIRETSWDGDMGSYFGVNGEYLKALARAGRLTEAEKVMEDMLAEIAFSKMKPYEYAGGLNCLIEAEGEIMRKSQKPGVPLSAEAVGIWNKEIAPARERFIAQARSAYLPFLDLTPEDFKEELKVKIVSRINKLYRAQETEVLKRFQAALNGGKAELSDGTFAFDVFGARMQKIMEAMKDFMPVFKQEIAGENYPAQAQFYSSLFTHVFELCASGEVETDIDADICRVMAYGWQVSSREQKEQAGQVLELIRAITAATQGMAEKETLRKIGFFLNMFVARDPVKNAPILKKQLNKILSLSGSARDRYLMALDRAIKDADLKTITAYLNNPDQSSSLAEAQTFVVFLTNEVEQVRKKAVPLPQGTAWEFPAQKVKISQVMKLEQRRPKKVNPDGTIDKNDRVMDIEYLHQHINSLPEASEQLEGSILRDVNQAESGARARELPQNSLDGTSGLGHGEFTVDCYVQEGPSGEQEYVEEASDDGTGAPQEPALIIPVSTKGDLDLAGKFGIGKFTNFEGVDRLEYINRNAERALVFSYSVARNESGRATALTLSGVSDVTQDPAVKQGLTVRMIKSAKNTIPEIDQMLARRAYKSFAGLSQNENFKIYFIDQDGKKQPLTVEHEVLSEAMFAAPASAGETRAKPKPFRIISCKDMPRQVINEYGFRVGPLTAESEYFALVPHSLLRFVKDLNISIQIPLELTRNREGFAEVNLPYIQRYVAIEFYKAIVYKTLSQTSPQFLFANFPTDWQTDGDYWDTQSPLKDAEVVRAANAINKGEYESIPQAVLENILPQPGELDKAKRYVNLMLLLDVPDPARPGKKVSLFGRRSRVRDEIDRARSKWLQDMVKEQGLDEISLPDKFSIPQFADLVQQGRETDQSHEQMRNIEKYIIDPAQYSAEEREFVDQALAIADKLAEGGDSGKTDIKQVLLLSDEATFAGSFADYKGTPTFLLSRFLAKTLGQSLRGVIDEGTNTIVHELAHWFEIKMRKDSFPLQMGKGFFAHPSNFTHDAKAGGTFYAAMVYAAGLSLPVKSAPDDGGDEPIPGAGQRPTQEEASPRPSGQQPALEQKLTPALQLAPGTEHGLVPALPLGQGAAAPVKPDAFGGIDLRHLPIPIRAQAIFTPLSASALDRIDRMDEAVEWRRIRTMLDSGMIPSCDNIRFYLLHCCRTDGLDSQLNKILTCLADILRLEEDRGYATEPALKQILALLESDTRAEEMLAALQ